jgi:uncharacterized membrane protein YidH (DUF202 family)
VPSAADGLQRERTALAWQRTALSLVVGSVLLARLTFDRLGALALASPAIALPLSVWVLVQSRRRYRGDPQRRLRRGGGTPAVLAVAAAALALTELAALALT